MSLLDNLFWHTFTGPQAHLATGTARAKRYLRGFSPMLGFPDQAHPDFTGVEAFFDPGERFYTDGWSCLVPEGWQLEMESTMFKMIWDGGLPEDDAAPEALPLGPEHVDQAVALAELTKPGPFGPRTIELGEYFGCFEGGRLVAMAGERLHAGSLREISGVCTHPDFQGRGLAKRLMLKLIRRQLQRGETPCLHVASGNTGAHGLYLRMGFKDHKESAVRIVSRVG
ncbi:MAG TPA: GNAT family N-acetyltransferase [Holophagaceae bacterium]|nr:GNAT family N-acetyltransferase [Holophagaceae bacterium]